MGAVDDYLDRHRDRHVEELKDLLRIPSVSAQPDRHGDVRAAAEWVRRKLERCGLQAELIETSGQPIAYGEWLKAPGAPTVLVYGHYDVQPPEPLDLWQSPPFEPTERNGNLYARGSTDDKGQMLTHLQAIEAWLQAAGKLPVNVKVVIEGEEEVGSGGMYGFLESHAARLKCDVAAISDTSMFDYDLPAVTYGLKGIAYFEVFVTGANTDLHSGTFGGAVQNPCNALAEIIASLKDRRGRVLVPGFYDDVVDLTEIERAAFRKLPFDEAKFAADLGLKEVFGEAGFTTLERKGARPTCDVNGIWGGYQGEGAKTVLPNKAGAKFSFRLVPNQNPDRVAELLQAHLKAVAPPGVTVELKVHHGAPACVVPLDSPYMAAATAALAHAFGKEPVFIREGGSIPIVGAFKQKLGVDTLLLGYGLNDDAPHAPNEKFRLADYHRGIRANAKLLEELASIRK